MKQRTPLLSSEPSDNTKYSSTKVNKPSVLFQHPIEQVKNSQPLSTPMECKNPAINNNCSSNITLTYHKSYAKPANLASEENSTSELDVDYDEKEDDEEDEEDAFSDEEEEDAEEARDRKANDAPNLKELVQI